MVFRAPAAFFLFFAVTVPRFCLSCPSRLLAAECRAFLTMPSLLALCFSKDFFSFLRASRAGSVLFSCLPLAFAPLSLLRLLPTDLSKAASTALLPGAFPGGMRSVLCIWRFPRLFGVSFISASVVLIPAALALCAQSFFLLSFVWYPVPDASVSGILPCTTVSLAGQSTGISGSFPRSVLPCAGSFVLSSALRQPFSSSLPCS